MMYEIVSLLGVLGKAFLDQFLLLVKTKLQSVCLVKPFVEKISKTLFENVRELQKLGILAFRKIV